MKTLLLSLLFFAPLGAGAATCTGADPCKACKNCSACRHCAIEGQSCGTMRDQTPEQTEDRDRKRARRRPAPPADPAPPKLGATWPANVR